jgi:hypothetical protein
VKTEEKTRTMTAEHVISNTQKVKSLFVLFGVTIQSHRSLFDETRIVPVGMGPRCAADSIGRAAAGANFLQ